MEVLLYFKKFKKLKYKTQNLKKIQFKMGMGVVFSLILVAKFIFIVIFLKKIYLNLVVLFILLIVC